MLLRSGLLTLFLLVRPRLAQAQLWPERPWRLLVPFAAGSVTDSVGRLSAEVLGARLRVASLPEFIAHLRANPGRLSYSSGGNGSSNHLANGPAAAARRFLGRACALSRRRCRRFGQAMWRPVSATLPTSCHIWARE